MIEDRFWSKVDIRGHLECWEWKGGVTKNGYGHINPNDSAHRYAYKMCEGPIPEGMVVMHTCDNRLCCNPRHLRLGTYQDNTDDMKAKRRHRFGKTHWNAKLREEEVYEIRRLYATGKISQTYIGAMFRVTQGMVGLIVRGVSWRNLLFSN